MSILPVIAAHTIGIVLFLFFYWRSLREDYTSEKIFSSAFIIIIATIVGGLISSALSHSIGASKIFSPRGMWFWGAGVGMAGGFWWAKKRFQFRPFETLETAVGGILLWLFSLSFLEAKILTLILFLMIILFFYLQKNYRKFSWYKSGRVGLAGLTTIVIFFLIRSILTIFFYDPMVSFGRTRGYSLLMGRVDAIISATIAFCFILCIYNLSRAKR